MNDPFHVRSRCSVRKGVLGNFTKFTGEQLCQTETLAQVFSCEFCKISKNSFLQNTSGRLLLSCPTAGSQSQAAYNRFPKKADFLKLGKTHIILESSF